MRIPSGKTDQLIYFVALSSNGQGTRKTGLTTFTVYRSRNGGAATVYTTPTIAELSTANMPGIYSLAIDEDTTIAAGSDSEEYCVHITQASMAPVTRVMELYRRDTTTGNTALVDGNGRVDVIKIAGTTQTARDIGTSVLLSTGTGTGQLDFTSGVVKVNATQWLGGTIPAVNVTGVPIVDDKYLLGTAYSTPATAGIQDINVKNITNTVATAFGQTTAAIGRGTVTTGGSTTSIPTSAFSPAGAVADQFKNRIVMFDAATTTTALRGQIASISASSNAATPTFTVGTMTTAPASGDTFSVL